MLGSGCSRRNRWTRTARTRAKKKMKKKDDMVLCLGGIGTWETMFRSPDEEQIAGIKVEGENSWLMLIQNANKREARGRQNKQAEPFANSLGTRKR